MSYGALARAADTGCLSGRMRDALTQHLLGDASDLYEEYREHLAGLERRVAALEKGARERPEGDDLQTDGLQEALSKLGEEQDHHGRRIAALESRGSTPTFAPSTNRVEQLPTDPRCPAFTPTANASSQPGDRVSPIPDDRPRAVSSADDCTSYATSRPRT